MIEEIARHIPETLMERSGSVFYSGRDAFAGQRPLYILGLNPGGDPRRQAAETIRWHTRKVLEREPANWSAYRDESWKGAPAGTFKMQPRVLHLLRRLDMDPGEVPASNIVFVRSQREDRLDGNLADLAEQCWPFHQEVIRRLGVRTVLCFGQSAGDWVRARLGAGETLATFVEHNNRRWKTRAFRAARGIKVIVATHPSIAKWDAPATDPSDFVGDILSRG